MPQKDTCPYCMTRVSRLERHIELKHEKFTFTRFLGESKTTILTGILLLGSLLFIMLGKHPLLFGGIPLHKILLGISIAVGGLPLLKVAIEEVLQEYNFDVDFLVVIAAIGAIIIEYWIEAGVLIFLFSLSETLSDYSIFRNRKMLKNLLDLSPANARVSKDGKTKEVPPEEVKIGDRIVVKPGERIPIDGEIMKGLSAINEAPITGESLPVEKRKGDEVYAGTLNTNGSLLIRATKKSIDSTLSRIVQMVEETKKSKAKTEKFVNRFVKFYTPLILIVAALVFLIPPLLFSTPYRPWLYRSLVLLVLSCPCAFAISTPVSMFSAVTHAARRGVLVKGGNFIERLKKVDILVLDKTRTLTTGHPQVTDILPLGDYSSMEILSLAASLEKHSAHPLAKAITDKFDSLDAEQAEIHDVNEFKALTGLGIQGIIDDTLFKIGRPELFEFDGHALEHLNDLSSQGNTVVVLGTENQPIGMIGMRDTLRRSAKETIHKLKQRGIHTVMLTGDNERTAQAVAKEIGINAYRAEILPEEKVKEVENLRKEGTVVMVGDGVNDAPALAKSHVGIAMGAAGSDVALESADIALMQDDLSKIVYLLDFSKETMKVIKENIYASIAGKLLLAILAFFGFVTLWMAVGIGDVGLALFVTINALLLGKQ